MSWRDGGFTQYVQKKFRNLTSDYTESCCWRSVNQEMRSRRCDTAEMRDMRFWRVGTSQLRRTGGCGGSAAQDVAKICTTPAHESDLEVKIVQNSPKFAPRLRARTISKSKSLKTAMVGRLFEVVKSPKFAPGLRGRTIWKSKSLKTEGFGTLLEVQASKICTTPARENELEVKTVKAPGGRDVSWNSKRLSRGRCRDFGRLQSTWQAQEFVRVAQTLAGVVALKRVWNDAFRVGSARISLFAMSMFEASDAESVAGLQI